jgi:hypothetical protein
MLQIREEDADLALCRDERVAAVHEVLGEQDAEVAPDRSRRGLTWVGGANDGPNDVPGVLGPSSTMAITGPRLMNDTRSS